VKTRILEWRQLYLKRLGLGPEHWGALVALSKELLPYPQRIAAVTQLSRAPGLTPAGREELIVVLADTLAGADRQDYRARGGLHPAFMADWLRASTRQRELTPRELEATGRILCSVLGELAACELRSREASTFFLSPSIPSLLCQVLTDPRTPEQTAELLTERSLAVMPEALYQRRQGWAPALALALAFSPHVSEEQFDEALARFMALLPQGRRERRARRAIVEQALPLFILGPRLSSARAETVLTAVEEDVNDLGARPLGAALAFHVLAGFPSNAPLGLWYEARAEREAGAVEPLGTLPITATVLVLEREPDASELRVRAVLRMTAPANRFTLVRRPDLGLMLAICPYRYLTEDGPVRQVELAGFIGRSPLVRGIMPFEPDGWVSRPGNRPSTPSAMQFFLHLREPTPSEEGWQPTVGASLEEWVDCIASDLVFAGPRGESAARTLARINTLRARAHLENAATGDGPVAELATKLLTEQAPSSNDGRSDGQPEPRQARPATEP
jgi:hypothetical protein